MKTDSTKKLPPSNDRPVCESNRSFFFKNSLNLCILKSEATLYGLTKLNSEIFEEIALTLSTLVEITATEDGSLSKGA
jgi:hypothetical protein